MCQSVKVKTFEIMMVTSLQTVLLAISGKQGA